MRGTIVKFDSERRFGFIRPNAGGDDIFFHENEVLTGRDEILPGATVTFETATGEKGVKAIKVKVTTGAPVSPYKFFLGATILLTATLTVALTLYGEIPPLLAYLVAINGATFIALGFDKSSAAFGSTRVPEKILFLCAALGGSLGLLLAITLFRHKTQKSSLQFVVALIFIAQMLAFQLLRHHL
jgi:uncharacterized membrane protein YsdA (DUF1294 family)/cold shock CspA family protein